MKLSVGGFDITPGGRALMSSLASALKNKAHWERRAAHWRALFRQLEEDVFALEEEAEVSGATHQAEVSSLCEKVKGLEKQLGEAKADNEPREKLLAELRQKVEDLTKQQVYCFSVGDWVRVECEGHPAHGKAYQVESVDRASCSDGYHYVLKGAPLARADGGAGGSPGFWCGETWLRRVEASPGATEPDEAREDSRKLAQALLAVGAELDRILNGGLRLHKNEVKRIRSMIPLPAEKSESSA